MSNTFNVKINCVLFSTNINLNKRYLLSLDSDKIILPSFDLLPEHLENTEYKIIEFLKQFVFVNDLELLPQLININSKLLSNNTNDLNVIYGFVINHTNSINNSHWIEFDLLAEQKYSTLLFEVMQKLK